MMIINPRRAFSLCHYDGCLVSVCLMGVWLVSVWLVSECGCVVWLVLLNQKSKTPVPINTLNNSNTPSKFKNQPAK